MNNTQRRRLFPAVWFAATVAFVGIGCRWAVPRPTRGTTQESVQPHRTFPGNCGICHVGQGWGEVRLDVSFDHEEEASHRLEGAHADAGCLACHNDRGPVTTYVVRGCGGCHPDPHASALGPDCGTCHGQTEWKPEGPASEGIETRFHAVPAHAVPPCQSCHTQGTGALSQHASVQCRSCHQAGSVQH